MFWNILDEDGSGLLDVGEFLRGLLGEMSEARVGIVHRAWVKIDPGRIGEVSYKTVRQFYNPAISLNPDSGKLNRIETSVGLIFRLTLVKSC